MSPLAWQIAYRAFRAWNRPEFLPFSYTFSVTARCNYRCATCRSYRSESGEIPLADYRRLFRSVGSAPWWSTFTGGEPFLREDLEGIIGSFCDICRPKLVNIPTNGSFPEKTAGIAARLARRHQGTGFIVNVSIDSVGERQNAIRGSSDAWGNAVRTIEALKRNKPPNLLVGIGTVISKMNLGNFAEDRRKLSFLGADSMVAEVAEHRKELLNEGIDIVPDPEEYRPISELLIAEAGRNRKRGWAGLAQAFRRLYYGYAGKALQGQSKMKCYAGFASAYVAPDGAVWGCCLKGDEMGRLPEHGFDFRKLWSSEKAREARRKVKARECSCPLANAAYVNMMLDWRYASRIIIDTVRASWRK